MSDMDSNTDSGVGGVAASQTSGEGAKPNSIDTSKIAAEVASLLKPDIEKMVQSTKDKRIEGFQQKYDKVLKILDLTPDEAKNIGLSVPEPAKTETVSPAPSGKEDVAGAIVEKFLEASGLRLDDPNVVAFQQRSFANEQEKMTAVAELVAKMASPKPASPVATPPPSGGSAPQRTVESVTAELESELKKSKLDVKKVEQLQEELTTLT